MTAGPVRPTVWAAACTAAAGACTAPPHVVPLSRSHPPPAPANLLIAACLIRALALIPLIQSLRLRTRISAHDRDRVRPRSAESALSRSTPLKLGSSPHWTSMCGAAVNRRPSSHPAGGAVLPGPPRGASRRHLARLAVFRCGAAPYVCCPRRLLCCTEPKEPACASAGGERCECPHEQS